ncbi:MAG: HU family DNA-binding protein [Muribaculaceae bacterium]|nr:HU family DNA-binding protein [Muribaculaceae bacterium]
MLTLNDLSKTLAEMTGCQPAEADDFLRELFALAAETLETQGRVEVPLIGSFAIKDTSIQFLPDPDLAAEINTPFADFTPIEVPADFTLTQNPPPGPPTQNAYGHPTP